MLKIPLKTTEEFFKKILKLTQFLKVTLKSFERNDKML